MKQYLDLLNDVLSNGTKKEDRTGTGTLSVFGRQLRFNLQEGFPLVTTKKVFWKGVVGELLWFLKGSTNVRELQEQGITIWDAWANEFGDLGPVYGAQWRMWQGLKIEEISGSLVTGDTYWIDQIAEVIQSIKNNPDSRRHIVSAWNVADIPRMALPPCHLLFQFYVAEGKLSCQLYQRSADLFLGVPFNIASYSLLTHMIAQVCDLDVGEFIITFGDAHIYLNHIKQVKTQLERDPYPLPTLQLNHRISDIDKFTPEDIKLLRYFHHHPIKGEVAV